MADGQTRRVVQRGPLCQGVRGYPRVRRAIEVVTHNGELMPRLRPRSRDDVTPAVRALLEQAERSLGGPAVAAGIQAYCPPILEASRALGAAPAKSGTLSPALRALVQLRAAQLVRCPF